MTSVNPHFTFRYSQPDEYHFSHDSVFLARRAFEDIAAGKLRLPGRALDLCAGCGVIGLDFLLHLQRENCGLPQAMDFLEVQEIYRPHWVRNTATLKKLLPAPPALGFLPLNYKDLPARPQYDLILCNPPYFRPGHGKPSPSAFKNRCRFFLDADFSELLHALERTLAPEGTAYVLLRSLEEHGISLEREIRQSGVRLRFESPETVRGTPLYRFRPAGGEKS